MSKHGWRSPGRVLSVRVDLGLYDALGAAAASRSLSLGDYVRRVLVDIIEHPTVDSTPTEPHAYRRGVSYVAGTRVLVPTRRGDLVEMVAPELDADGRPIPEDS